MRRFIIGIMTAIAVAACFVGLVGCGDTATDGGEIDPPHYGGDIIEIPDPTLRYYTFAPDAAGTGCVLTDVDGKLSGDVEIPAIYKNLPVVGIGDRAFADCKNIGSVSIPDSVTSIGAYAFDNCKGLQSVKLPAALTEIGAWSFCNCTSLTAVALPAALTTIGAYAFWSCNKLTTAAFAVTDGWRAYWSADAPAGADPAAGDLGDPSKAAALLKTTYNYCQWRRAAADE